MPEIVDQDQWGICGFVSVLNGLRDAGKLTSFTGGQSSAMSLEDIQTRLYAEIVTYLKYLVFTRSPLISQIEEISAICAPEGTPKRKIGEIVRFIETKLRKIAKQHAPDETSIRRNMRALIGGQKDDNITVAMTPDALVDYMKWAGVKNAAQLTIVTTANSGLGLLAYPNCIIGLGEKPGPRSPYNGLEHWIYVDQNGVLNNWGKKKQLAPTTDMVATFGSWAKFITHVIRMG